eukprot:snap_masked-scaffold_5-processed-gene-18.15-mRNA-1 protein AED:1.00 eAED:1.00 QI:0/-1/0/0/-1/1/1/0/686
MDTEIGKLRNDFQIIMNDVYNEDLPDSISAFLKQEYEEDKEITIEDLQLKTDQGGRNLFHVAIERQNTALLWSIFNFISHPRRKTLEVVKNFVNEKTDKGLSILHLCCWGGYSYLVTLLFKNNLIERNLVNETLDEVYSPLLLSILFDNLKAVEILLENGADVKLEVSNEKLNIFHLFPMLSNAIAMKRNEVDDNILIHFFHLIEERLNLSNEEQLKSLVQKKTKSGETIFHTCIIFNCFKLFVYLKNKGLFDSLTFDDDKNPLFYSVQYFGSAYSYTSRSRFIPILFSMENIAFNAQRDGNNFLRDFFMTFQFSFYECKLTAQVLKLLSEKGISIWETFEMNNVKYSAIERILRNSGSDTFKQFDDEMQKLGLNWLNIVSLQSKPLDFVCIFHLAPFLELPLRYQREHFRFFMESGYGPMIDALIERGAKVYSEPENEVHRECILDKYRHEKYHGVLGLSLLSYLLQHSDSVKVKSSYHRKGDLPLLWYSLLSENSQISTLLIEHGNTEVFSKRAKLSPCGSTPTHKLIFVNLKDEYYKIKKDRFDEIMWASMYTTQTQICCSLCSREIGENEKVLCCEDSRCASLHCSSCIYVSREFCETADNVIDLKSFLRVTNGKNCGRAIKLTDFFCSDFGKRVLASEKQETKRTSIAEMCIDAGLFGVNFSEVPEGLLEGLDYQLADAIA